MDSSSLTTKEVGGIESITKAENYYSIQYVTGEVAKLNILNDHVFRFYMSPTKEFLEYPVPHNSEDLAKITIKQADDYGYEAFKQSSINEQETHFVIHVNDIQVVFDKIKGIMKIHNESTNKDIFVESNPLSYTKKTLTQTLLHRSDEYFFGGGMQNGRYSHKGETIKIAVTNKWTEGGVSSPCPFYWSTYGYGVLRNTWQPGTYHFGSKSKEHVITCHNDNYFDAFIFINQKPSDILIDYYELTGEPIVLPEYAYYEAHLNAFNRDYWVKVDSDTNGAILFEDNSYYKCYKPEDIGDKTGILESLNGNNQFSARAMIDRYKKHDMPLGWFIPNDGYGCGYGQTDSLDGDIQNLKEFTEYSLQNGVQVGLWTESNIYPDDPMNPKKGERDLSKEVGIANIVALKCDEKWIGNGYSFGLNAIKNAAITFKEHTKSGVRPMILTINGWAGTQRHAAIWSGDQKGGEWEYIRFHIPSYIGTGLSGQPIVGADMDGIYEGGDKSVNIRDYQWKTFTPLQLNMDGWGRIPKTPFSFDDEATSINRAYLKLKSMLMPYNYTIGYESRDGLPMLRAMFLEFPECEFAYTTECQYQFMWGPNLLIAPVYNDVEFNYDSVRNGIFLPDQNQIWIDFFTGIKYHGGKILNNFTVPLWKLPVFVKDGSIIPMTNANNNPFEIQRDNRIFTLYPNGKTSFDMYEDDGITCGYLESHYAMTTIKMVGPSSNEQGDLSITINQTTGSYKDMTKDRSTLLQIMASCDVDKVAMTVNGELVDLIKVDNEDDFKEKDNVFYFKTDFIINPYLKEVKKVKKSKIIEQKFLLIKICKMDVTSNTINITINNYQNYGVIIYNDCNLNTQLKPPKNLSCVKDSKSPNFIFIQWDDENRADYYEIETNGQCHTSIVTPYHEYLNLRCNTKYSFRVRSIKRLEVSEWSDSLDVITDDPFKFVIGGVDTAINHGDSDIDNRMGDSEQHKIFDFQLTFDLQDLYNVDRIEYRPFADSGNQPFVYVQYQVSDDGEEWSELSDPIGFDNDYSMKTLPMDGRRFRYFKLIVLHTVHNYNTENGFLFFKTSE